MKSSLLADPHNLERLQTLARMLRTCRPMGGRTDRWFREYYLLTLPGATVDAYGNIHVTIARVHGDASRVVWSSHTDTVHTRSGAQNIAVGDRWISLADKRSNCLGADDTVGVWIMREMILARVPGHYVFHYGEEHGGIGSSDVVREEPQRYADALFAIAFDRRGRRDVITHQAGRRTASDAFAKSLAKALRPVARYRPSSHGIYTDTAEYAELIPECTNVSVGYRDEHTRFESVHYWHAIALCSRMRTFDESVLVCARDIALELELEARERADRAQRWSRYVADSKAIDDYYHARVMVDRTTRAVDLPADAYADVDTDTRAIERANDERDYAERYMRRRGSKLFNATHWKGRIN